MASSPREAERAIGAERATSASDRKSMTIGAVAKILSREFDDISISKIRYLEDQKLLSPRRTPGGYRLYSQSDVERLRAILRMQRDEFLPLRVIRQELAAGATRAAAKGPAPARRAASVDSKRAKFTLDELIEDTSLSGNLIHELEEFEIVQPETVEGLKLYDETDREIVRAAAELNRFGVAGRNLRVFRTSADREAALLEQVIGPSLRTSNQTRRREAIENLDTLTATVGHIKHLMLVRDLRRLTGD
jgi:DNA-binding transcriptional MerR regulator